MICGVLGNSAINMCTFLLSRSTFREIDTISSKRNKKATTTKTALQQNGLFIKFNLIVYILVS